MTTATNRRPGAAYWVSVLLGVPAAGAFGAWATHAAGMVSSDGLLTPVVIAALTGALALASLPRLAQMAPRARAAWAIGGAVLGTGLMLAYGFALLIGWLIVACPDGGCFS